MYQIIFLYTLSLYLIATCQLYLNKAGGEEREEGREGDSKRAGSEMQEEPTGEEAPGSQRQPGVTASKEAGISVLQQQGTGLYQQLSEHGSQFFPRVSSQDTTLGTP